MQEIFQESAGDSKTVVLTLTEISKTYTTVPVLTDISLTLMAGEVLILAGENGAGKSTLSKIISGIIPPTQGTMLYNRTPFAPASRLEAEFRGIRMVMQELNLLPTLTIAENLYLHRFPARKGWILQDCLREQARYAMARVGLDSLHPDTLVGELGIGHQQMVEIARNLIGECKVLILDEPTAMLTEREVDLLFGHVKRLKKEGVSILYISHRLEEFTRIADRVAVLRDGNVVSVGSMDEYSTNRLISLMAGREIGDQFTDNERKIGPPFLRIEHLTRGKAVQDISFDVRKGEIFGISGLVGSGRTELLRTIFGADRKDSGTILVGDPLQVTEIRSPRDAVKQGIALIPEDRKGEGLLLSESIAFNLVLGNFGAVSKAGWVDRGFLQRISDRQIGAMHIRCTGIDQPVGALSGGNQQKVLIGRWLEQNAGVLLFDEPTRGVDIGTKFDIYALLSKEARKGKAVVVVSSDLRELMLICNRIGVISGGKLVKIFGRGEWSRDSLLAAAFSGHLKNRQQID